MSNSPLVSYTKISPNKTVGRNHAIDTITPHCVVGQCSVEALGNIFAPTDRQASSNYGIGVDGRVGMYCEEKDRSWCTSSSANDNRAVTIECASDASEPYAFKDVVYNKLIELCVDICKRNGKTKLLWLGDKAKTLAYKPAANEMLLTVHRWFANKSCPGNWMYARMGDLAEKVTAQLCFTVEEEGIYIKGFAKQLSPNFNSNEFDCHGNGCCSETLIDQKLVELLQRIRDHFGKAITITSGYRCPTHNSKVSRAKNSYHTKGQAADFTVSGVTPREVAKYAESIGIKGIGLYETDRDGHFVHIDTRTTKAFWYGQAESPVTTFGGSATETPKEPEKEETTSDVLYRVQVGAYSFLANARQLQKKIKAAGFETYLVKADDGLFKVQVGAFAKYENAEKQVAKIKAAGFNCFITTKSGKPVDEETTDTDTKVEASAELEEGDKVKLTKDATVYGTTGTFQPWVYKSTLYVREISGDRVVVSTVKTGPVTGAVHEKHLTKV